MGRDTASAPDFGSWALLASRWDKACARILVPYEEKPLSPKTEGAVANLKAVGSADAFDQTFMKAAMKKLKLIIDKKTVVQNFWEVTAFIGLDSHFTDANGRILLSTDCRTATEVHTWANALIKELEDIKRKAAKIQWDNHPSSGGKG